MSEWQKVKIGKFLFERQGRYKPDNKDVSNLKRIEKINFSGTFFIGDKSSRTDMILIKKGDFVISGINVAKGAMGIYREDDDVTATIHYSSYTFDEKEIDIDFFELFLRSSEFIRLLKEQVKGGIKTELKAKQLLHLEINLPDLTTQKEIVQILHKIESNHQNLFKQTNFQKSNLTLLRQQILQDAISGKLTENWRAENPDAEPASKLLEQIKAEKKNLITEKKIKKEKPLSKISKDKIPFELSKGWEWCRLGEICNNITKGSSPKWQGVNYVNNKDEGILFITSKNVDRFGIDLSNTTYVERKFNDIEPRSILKKGDILTNIVGASIGRTAIYNLDDIANINQAVCILRIEHDLINKDFLLYLMNSSFMLKMMFDNQFDPGRANLSMSNIAMFTIPIPPRAEQKAIVVKVERLMGYVSQLEEKIEQNTKNAETLMQAFLGEIFRK